MAVISIIVVALILNLYFVPTAVAMKRGHQNTAAIVVINIFLGWTLLGWVAALAWAVSAITPPTVNPMIADQHRG